MEIRNEAVIRQPAGPLDPSKLPFGRNFSPNMFLIDFDEGTGWHDPRIVPYGPIPLPPSAMVFHYGQEIFEGLKGFKHPDGSIHLFRPDRNASRMNRSARRMCMPELPVEIQLEAMKALISIDRDWVPPNPGALYVRPTMIATQAALGVHASKSYTYFIITGPTGEYFGTGGKAVRIMVARDWVRACPGGTGEAKTGGNYASSLAASAVAQERGCNQVMWLDAIERRHVEEVGAMNLMFVFSGVVTTPALSGSILPGITRESLGAICPAMGIPFVERAIHIDDVLRGLETGHCTEVFGCGTAAVISAVGELLDGEQVYKVGSGEEGPVARRLRESLTSIQTGAAPDTRDWLLKVC